MTDKKIFGVTALFNDPNAIFSAAKKVADAGFSKWDVNSPYPIHGIDKAMKMKPSKLGIVTLIFGLFFTLVILFTKALPVISIAEVKAVADGAQPTHHRGEHHD